MSISNKWYVHFPRDAYALGPFQFSKPISERTFRARIRKWWGITSTRGINVWIAGE